MDRGITQESASVTKVYPWDYHPDLAQDRITAVAQMIVEGRQTAVELFDENAGDNGWTLGCRAFQFARARILRADADGVFDWLGIIDRSLQLTFTIGEVPVRIYRGEADEPTVRTMRQSFNELRQIGFSFDDFDEGRELAYRFAIETDADGSVLAVKFVGLRGGTAILNWEVPIEVTSGSGGIGRPATEAVELEAPSIGVRERETKIRE